MLVSWYCLFLRCISLASNCSTLAEFTESEILYFLSWQVKFQQEMLQKLLRQEYFMMDPKVAILTFWASLLRKQSSKLDSVYITQLWILPREYEMNMNSVFPIRPALLKTDEILQLWKMGFLHWSFVSHRGETGLTSASKLTVGDMWLLWNVCAIYSHFYKM